MQLPQYYEFFSQSKFSSGMRALENIPSELADLNAKRPLVITSQAVRKAGGTIALVHAFKESGMTIAAMYDDAAHTSTLVEVMKLSSLFRSEKCDSIIALGGGGIADIAKCVNIAVTSNDNPMHLRGTDKILNRLKPLIYVATAQASGSETSSTALLDDAYFTSSFLFPDLIVIDFRMMLCAKRKDILEAAVTAFVHSAEVYSSKDRNPLSNSYSYTAIQYIYENLPKISSCCGYKKRALALANAEAMSGIATSNLKADFASAIGRECAAFSKTAAGFLMGTILPHALAFGAQKGAAAGELLRAIGGLEVFSATPELSRAEKAVQLVRDFNKKLKLVPDTLSSAGIPKDKLSVIAKNAASKHGISEADALAVLERAF